MKYLSDGDLFTINEFCEFLDNRCIISYDGYGFYTLGEIESGELVDFNSAIVRKKSKNKGYTGVKWFNK